MTDPNTRLRKRLTGIKSFDVVTDGGLPSGAAILVLGGAGAGKTVLCLQILAAAIERGEAGILISFEESVAQLLRDAASFVWGSRIAESSDRTLIDARPQHSLETSGGFDLNGLIAIIQHRINETGADWVVLDGLDQLLKRQPDDLAVTDQIRMLSDWCESQNVTVILTGKLASEQATPAHLEGIEFLLSGTFILSARLVEHRLNRRFQIAKYRGTAHVTDELAMLIDSGGIQIPYGVAALPERPHASTERISTGVRRLDETLGGGLYRGSTTLISGQPGTSKTTLCGAFAAAAANRGERALFISFDEHPETVTRNLRSVGIDLQAPMDSGHLRFHAREAWAYLVEDHYMALVRLMDQFEPHCLIIDPISALLEASGAESGHTMTERLMDIARTRGITTMLTSLTTQDQPESESTLSHASTLADTWISLSYSVRAGERNRALSVVKSRGSAHSNQVRELILSSDGIDLADVYEFGSEVLMGTARVHKRNEIESRRQLEALAQERQEHEVMRQLEQAHADMERSRREAQCLEEQLALTRRQREQSMEDSKSHLAEVHEQRVHRNSMDFNDDRGNS